MDAELKDLIETIKSEGVQSAEKQAAEIVEQAEERAKRIVEEAEQRAEQIRKDAEQEAQRREQSEKEVVAQAGRDLLLSLQNRIRQLFRSVTESTIRESYSQEVVEESVVKLVSAWAEKQTRDVTVLLSEEDYQALEDNLRKRLGDALKSGVELKASPHVQSGFRVTEKGGTLYYDFSAQGIAESLSAFLNPRLQELMKQAVQEASENE